TAEFPKIGPVSGPEKAFLPPGVPALSIYAIYRGSIIEVALYTRDRKRGDRIKNPSKRPAGTRARQRVPGMVS
ncbi:MAG: hypothetical protein LBS48_05225, partial [Treponema sp.]|nr:hypothetical protein [Treponema sp.]